MTAIEKVLLRKDISSLIVAIVAGTAVAYFLAGFTSVLASQLSFSDQFQGQNVPVGDVMLQSFISFALQVIALELLLRAVILARSFAYKKGK